MILYGNLQKMRVEAPGGESSPVAYYLRAGQDELALNPLIGQRLSLAFEGVINCVACGRKTKSSFSQGYCFPCAQALAECDLCIVSPEKCHHAAGTCRDPAWAQDHCMREHVVYLANTSGLKVGITRASQLPTRWIDQGATQAMPIFRTQTRHQAGLVEAAMRAFVADRTDWRSMLKGEGVPLDLVAERDRLLATAATVLDGLCSGLPPGSVRTAREAVTNLSYPMAGPAPKLTSIQLDKTRMIDDRLLGVKGRYLIFATGVLNVRKFSGYLAKITT